MRNFLSFCLVLLFSPVVTADHSKLFCNLRKQTPLCITNRGLLRLDSKEWLQIFGPDLANRELQEDDKAILYDFDNELEESWEHALIAGNTVYFPNGVKAKIEAFEPDEELSDLDIFKDFLENNEVLEADILFATWTELEGKE